MWYVYSRKLCPDYYRSQEMCNKAFDNYPNALEFFSECYKSQKKYVTNLSKCICKICFWMLHDWKNLW